MKIDNDIDLRVVALKMAKEKYYSGDSITSDKEFDDLEDELRKLDPTNDYFKLVGSNINYGSKIKHTFRMKSMNKAKTKEDIQKWLNKVEKVLGSKELTINITPKIDGLAFSANYLNGILRSIATRGNGDEGQDVTFLKDYLKFPKNIPTNSVFVEVKGEIFLPVNSNIPNPDNAPLRNIASGIVNSKSDVSNAKYLDYRAFSIKGNDIEQQLLYHSEFKKLSPYRVKLNIGNIELYYNTYLEDRNNLEYETDGIVISLSGEKDQNKMNESYKVENADAYNIAWKPDSSKSYTTLTGIEWSVSKNGNVTPVAIFKEVNILGSKINRASLYNYKTVQDMRLDVGCSIVVEKANDIIPKIVENLDYNTIEETNGMLIPSCCPSCEGDLVPSIYDDVNLMCSNPECDEIKIKKLIHYVKFSEMDGVAEATIRMLYDTELINSPIGLYTLTREDLNGIEGFGDRKIKKLLDEIKRTSTMDIYNFIKRLGIHSVGKRVAEKLEINSVKDFLNFNDGDDGSITGQYLIKYINDNVGFLNKLIANLTITPIIEKEVDMESKHVAVTGKYHMGRKELQVLLEDKGYIFDVSVTKDTDILLCEDAEGTSSKLVKARKNGTKIISYIHFMED